MCNQQLVYDGVSAAEGHPILTTDTLKQVNTSVLPDGYEGVILKNTGAGFAITGEWLDMCEDGNEHLVTISGARGNSCHEVAYRDILEDAEQVLAERDYSFPGWSGRIPTDEHWLAGVVLRVMIGNYLLSDFFYENEKCVCDFISSGQLDESGHAPKP